jgi:acyl transferase domain-containing protein
MTQAELVILFPGQGILQGSMFRGGTLRARYLQVLDEAAGAGDSVEGFVLAASVAHYRELVAREGLPAAIVGHGFGELVALVCAGAFTVSQGAEIARQRGSVLDQYQSEPGSMLSVATTSALAERLVGLAGASRTAIAAENAPTEIVISGTLPGIAAVRDRTRAEGIADAPLKARWALHCQQTLPAAVELRKRLMGFSARPLRVPVFSPTLRRYYRPTDDLAESLARQLILRVMFADAVRSLVADGARRFVECGPLHGLARSVHEVRAERPADHDDRGMTRSAAGSRRCDVAAVTRDEAPALAAAMAG